MTKKPKIQRGLNPEQQAVVDHGFGPIRVVATAGSGKTTALVERAARLVESGVSPGQILLISFSVVAKTEMEKRINARLPGRDAGKMCRTFHSIGLDIFRNEIDEDRSWAVDSTGYMTKAAIRTALIANGMRPSPAAVGPISELLSRAKNAMLIERPSIRRLSDMSDERKALLVMARLYSKALQEVSEDIDAEDLVNIVCTTEDIRRGAPVRGVGVSKRFVNYDDMLVHAVEALDQGDVRDRWSSRWTYVMQDEAQDENAVQAALADALCRGHRNYMVVGDPAQSLFGFRGANPQKILSFEEKWQGAVTIEMNRNYRSGVEIVSMANTLMGWMPADTVLGTDAISHRNTHSSVAYLPVFSDSDQEEAAAIAENIIAHHKAGVAWKDQAILVRANFQTSAIEAALAEAGVPHQMSSTDSFFSMPETGVFFGAMRLLAGRGRAEDVRSALGPMKAGKEFVDRVANRFEEDPNKDWESSVEIELHSPLGASVNRKARERIEDWLSAMRFCRGNQSATPLGLVETIQAIVSDNIKSAAIGDDELRARNVYSAKSFASRYESIPKLCDALGKIEALQSPKTHDRVKISTVHKAKGAEWPVVYVAGCTNGIFPMLGADLAEERRIFYVAITRAMDELWLSGGKETSRFVIECGASAMSWEPIGRRIKPNDKIGEQLSLI